jgi:hypothetical protein
MVWARLHLEVLGLKRERKMMNSPAALTALMTLVVTLRFLRSLIPARWGGSYGRPPLRNCVDA